MLTLFFDQNRILVYFVYPLIFFLMGFGIFLKNTGHSHFHLAKSLKFLGLFGILHGLADWGNIFIPIQKAFLSSRTLYVLDSLKIGINAISFFSLFYFGTHLYMQTKKRAGKILIIPILLLVIWFAFFIWLHPWFVNETTHDWRSVVSEIWARYLLAFPGAVISGYALFLQRKQFASFGVPSMTPILILAAFSMGLYALTGGIIVPYAPGSPAVFLNSDTFFHMTGIPVELFRALSGFLMAFFILKILKVFDLEFQNFFYKAEKQKAVDEERIKIARDLHDGVIQSIYATGLHLERIRAILAIEFNEKSEPAEIELQGVILRLNGLIREIREYIKQLQIPVSDQSSLKEDLERLFEEMDIRQQVEFRVEYENLEDDYLPLSQVVQIRYILKEALSNVIRHAESTQVTILIHRTDDELLLEVSDNGKGIDATGVESNPLENDFLHQGVLNMKSRAQSMGGELSISASKGMGTKVSLHLRYRGEGLHDEENLSPLGG